MNIFKRFLYLGAGTLGTIGSVVGIGSGLNSLFGGSSSSGGSPGTYVPTGRASSDQLWQQLLPLIANSIKQQQGNISGPVNTAYQATQPGGQFGYLPTLFQQFGNALLNSGAQDQANQGLLSSGGNQVFQTALDPQNALRDKLQQQVTDASRASTSSRGIGMSPEASGIENQDVSNFLINWQNQQLGRQLAGLQGMQGAMGTAGNLGGQAGQALTGAGGLYTTGMNLPFATANSYTGALQGPENAFAQLSPQILSYLGLGNQSAGQAFNQQNQGLGQIISGLGGLGGMFNQTQPPAPISDQSTQAPGTGGYGGP